jgi:hypothetical protein
MSARDRLPNRRRSCGFQFECAGLRYSCTYSKSDAGHVLELFLSNTKPASQSDTNARDSAVAASLALQYGVPIEVLRRAVLRNADDSAASPLGVALDIIAKLETEP